MKDIFLKDVLAEAKRMNPALKQVEQLKFYYDVQDKINTFSSNFSTSDTAFSKKQLAKLIINVFEPDNAWQINQFVEPN